MNDEKIIPIRPGARAEVPSDAAVVAPNAALIAALEVMLQEARAGEIVGMSCVYTTKEWHAAYQVVGFVGGFSMVGAAQCALQELSDAARGYTDG